DQRSGPGRGQRRADRPADAAGSSGDQRGPPAEGPPAVSVGHPLRPSRRPPTGGSGPAQPAQAAAMSAAGARAASRAMLLSMTARAYSSGTPATASSATTTR